MEATTPAVRAPLTHLPNVLTGTRLALIPVFVVLFLNAEGGHSWPAGVAFAIAAATDQVDGWLARRWSVESEFGKLVDPLADRLMIDAAVILLVVADRLPWPAVAIILARDAILLWGYKIVAAHGYQLSVNAVGKRATWVLDASLAFVIVTRKGTTWPIWLFWSGLALSLAAGGLYVASVWRTARR